MWKSEYYGKFVQVAQHGIKDIILGVIYGPPNTNVNDFVLEMGVILDRIDRENKPCYLMGDWETLILISSIIMQKVNLFWTYGVAEQKGVWRTVLYNGFRFVLGYRDWPTLNTQWRWLSWTCQVPNTWR